METQSQQILNFLKQGNAITPIDALNMFGCFRLGARIHDLRNNGYNIRTDNITRNGKTFASYKLIMEGQQRLFE